MAKVNKGLMKQWVDGETMHGPDYNRERDLVIDALNDAQDQVTALQSTTKPAVSTAMIQDSAVTTPKLANQAVTTAKIADGAVSTAKIERGTITGEKLADMTVESRYIASGAITMAKLANNSVGTSHIVDGVITSEKLNNLSIIASKIADWAIQGRHVSANAIQALHIATEAILARHLGLGVVSSKNLEDGAVTESKITEEAVTQFTYNKETVDQRIADALTSGIPQDVIDAIKSQVFVDVELLRERVVNNESAIVALQNVVPPAASETKAGITKLSSAVNSTSRTEAATPAAVKSAYDKANNALPMTGGWMEGQINFHKTTSPHTRGLGFAGDGSGWKFPIRRGDGKSVAEITDTGDILYFNNPNTGDVVSIKGQFARAQMHKVTQDDGISQHKSYIDANTLIRTGFYVGEAMPNMPSSGVGHWYYLEVQAMGNAYVLQRASYLFSPTLYMRVCANGTWSSWSPDLFQSGVDAKAGVVASLNAMGVPATTSDDWATASAKIRQISTFSRVYVDAGTGEQGIGSGQYRFFTLHNLGVVKNGFTVISPDSGSIFTLMAGYNGNYNYNDSSNVYVQIMDSAGQSETLANFYSPSGAPYVLGRVHNLSVDIAARTYSVTRSTSSSDVSETTRAFLSQSINLSLPLTIRVGAVYVTSNGNNGRASGNIRGYIHKW